MLSKISFLIATKNRGLVIKDTLDSLINQEIKEWEAIIVNDHGNDDTKEIVGGYRDDRFRFFELTDDHGMGISCARNSGVIYAQSDIIAILDSDDIAYPNRSKLTINEFKKNPDADVVYGDIDVWEENKNIIRDRNIPLYDYSLEKMKELHFIPNPAVAFKRKTLLNNPFNPFFKIAEDYELLTRLAISDKKFIRLNQKLTKYRINNDNTSIGKNRTDLAKNYNVLVKMIRGWIPFDKAILEEIETKSKDLL